MNKKLKKLFAELATSDVTEMQPLLDISETEFNENLNFMHTQVALYYKQLETELKRIIAEGENPENTSILKELKDVVDLLGPPPDEKQTKLKLDGIKKDKKQMQSEKENSKTFFLAAGGTSIPQTPPTNPIKQQEEADISHKIYSFLWRSNKPQSNY